MDGMQCAAGNGRGMGGKNVLSTVLLPFCCRNMPQRDGKEAKKKQCAVDRHFGLPLLFLLFYFHFNSSHLCHIPSLVKWPCIKYACTLHLRKTPLRPPLLFSSHALAGCRIGTVFTKEQLCQPRLRGLLRITVIVIV